MKVCYIYRKKDPLYFSIENVFAEISKVVGHTHSVEDFQLPDARVNFRALTANLRSVKKLHADIFHITGHVHYMVHALPPSRTVLTVHDCVFMHKTSGLRRAMLKKLLLDFPVRQAKYITAISEFTKNEIVQFTGCNPAKITVIPDPVDPNIRYDVRPFNSETPALLFLGSTPNKNLHRVLHALKGINCRLHIVGHIPDDAVALIKEFNIDVKQSSSLSARQLSDKFCESDVVVFPSTFEGFGLPIVEAQKAGRIVVTSNISPLKEVAGNAAVLVDPFNVESIRDGIHKAIHDASLRSELIGRGFENIKRYEPSHIAGQYMELYDRIKREGT